MRLVIEAVLDEARRVQRRDFRIPEWGLREERSESHVARQLHDWFETRTGSGWAQLFLPFGHKRPQFSFQFIAFVSEMFWPALLAANAVVVVRPALSIHWPLTALLVIALSIWLAFFVLYGAGAAYWNLYLLVFKGRQALWLKALVLGIGALTAYGVVEWLTHQGILSEELWLGGFRPEDEWRALAQTIAGNQFYRTAAWLLAYIPPAVSIGLLVGSALVAVGGLLFRTLKLALRLPFMEPMDELKDFLEVPLTLADGQVSVKLGELELNELERLRRWVKLRRELIQERLIPITIGAATVGILVDAGAGAGSPRIIWGLVVELVETLRASVNEMARCDFLIPLEMLNQPDCFVMAGLKVGVALAELAAVGLVVGAIVTYIGRLFLENVTAGFVAQACELALHNKERDRERAVDTEDKKVRTGWTDRTGGGSLLHWLGKIVGRLTG